MAEVKTYSNNYYASKQREYMSDNFKYAIHKQNVANLMKSKYNSDDDDVRDAFRLQRKEISRRYYLNKKAKMLQTC